MAIITANRPLGNFIIAVNSVHTMRLLIACTWACSSRRPAFEMSSKPLLYNEFSQSPRGKI